MRYGKAIIVGSGIAGLASARVLSDHFDEVTLVERDALPDRPEPRAGVGQGAHGHNLLPGGWDILRDLFPSLEGALDAAGGVAAQPDQWYALTPRGKTYRVSRYQPTPIASEDPASTVRLQTRALLEFCIRQAVELLPNVKIRDNSAVKAPLMRQGRMVGVQLLSEETMQADLVIDTTGRASQSLSWLDQAGFERPEESAVNCDFSYCSAFFKPHDRASFTDGGFLTSSAHTGPYTKRGGALARVEDDQWLVTLAGRLGDHPPRPIDAFLGFVETLHSPQLRDLLRQADLVDGPQRYMFPKSVRRKFHEMARFPEGLLVLGDAICQINPGYSQGMSVACRQAVALDQLLRARRDRGESLDGLWRPFFEAAYEQTRAPWLFAALIDFSKKGTTGDFPHEERAQIAEIKRLNKLADEGDPDAVQLIDSVFDMRQSLASIQI